MEKKKRDSKVVLCIACFFVVLVAYFPHLQSEVQLGHDDWFHFHRILAVASELRQGIFPVKIHHLAGYGHGYGVGFFYSNFFLYIPALLINFFDLPLDVAYRIFAFIIYVAIFGSMFLCLYKLTDKKEYAFWGASLYVFSNKVLEAFYVTVGVGQMCAFVFFPMAIIGMYLFLKENKKPTLLMFGFIGLIFSHTISTFMAVVVCGFFVLFNIKTLFADARKMINLILSVCVTTLITTSFWLPMFEQMKAQTLKVKAPWTASVENVLTLKSVVVEQVGLGYVIVTLFVFNVIMWGRNFLKKRGGEHQFTFIALFLVLLIMFKPFWYFMNVVLNIRFLQFPARFLAPITVLIIADATIQFCSIKIEKSRIKFIPQMMLLCAFALFFIVFSDSYSWVSNEHINEVIDNKIAGFGSGEEWLPIGTDREEILDANLAFDNEGNKVFGEKKKGYTRFVFEADLEKEYYDLPYIWYKGYGAVDVQGNKFEFSQNPETGMVQIHMPKDAEGMTQIEVYYKGTKYQKLAYVTSIIGIILLIVYLVVLKGNKEILGKQILVERHRRKKTCD